MALDRYPAPSAETYFSDDFKVATWENLTDKFINAILPPDTKPLTGHACITPQEIRDRERETGHDVVAFLRIYEERLNPLFRPLLHRGLTSSDLVDNTLMIQIGDHAGAMSLELEHMIDALVHFVALDPMPRPGRTHGQIAEFTTFNHQCGVWRDSLRPIQVAFKECAHLSQFRKSPGPVGNTVLRQDWPGGAVMSTQVIPRDLLLTWANTYLRLACWLENLALQIRLGSRAEVRELREGATASRIGSSAMPHKQNPIDSERVCGLARIARGYHGAIAEGTALWEDRDLTNSAPERIAVPGLAHIVEHMLATMTRVMEDLVVDRDRMLANARDPRCMTAIWQGLIQEYAQVGPSEASEVMRWVASNAQFPSVFTDHYSMWKQLMWKQVRRRWGYEVADRVAIAGQNIRNGFLGLE